MKATAIIIYERLCHLAKQHSNAAKTECFVIEIIIYVVIDPIECFLNLLESLLNAPINSYVHFGTLSHVMGLLTKIRMI